MSPVSNFFRVGQSKLQPAGLNSFVELFWSEMDRKYELQAIIGYLDYLRSPGEPFYTLEGGERLPDGTMTLPRTKYSERVEQFIADLYASRLVLTDFDWTSWQGEASRYIADPNLLNDAYAHTCAKLLTCHVRKEKFREGHFGGVLESGHVAAIVGRLKNINEMPPSG